MCLQDFFVQIYNRRPFRSSFLNKIIGYITKSIAYSGRFILPWYFKKFPVSLTSDRKKVDDLVVCFTSFPSRIETCRLIVECMLRQTVLPERIVLYLSKRQFGEHYELPIKLSKYIPNFLEVIWVEEDIRSHKKYWYAVRDFPKKTIVTIDDDIVYPSFLIEKLLNASYQHPGCVISNYWHIMKWGKDGILLPYSKWLNNFGSYNGFMESNEAFFGSGGGTLFPKGSLKDVNQSIDIILNCCPTADDIWLNAIVRKNKYKVYCLSKSRGVLTWRIINNKKLSTINNGLNNNDKQLKLVSETFLSLFGINPFSYSNY